MFCDVRLKLYLPSETGGEALERAENADLCVLVTGAVRLAVLLHKHLANACLKVGEGGFFNIFGLISTLFSFFHMN